MKRKTKQGGKEHTISIPPWSWWLMLFAGIVIGLYFGTDILAIIFTWISKIFTGLANLAWGTLTIIAIIIVIYIMIRLRISIFALILGIIIGIVIKTILGVITFSLPNIGLLNGGIL